jgi:hypothetical protein
MSSRPKGEILRNFKALSRSLPSVEMTTTGYYFNWLETVSELLLSMSYYLSVII